MLQNTSRSLFHKADKHISKWKHQNSSLQWVRWLRGFWALLLEAPLLEDLGGYHIEFVEKVMCLLMSLTPASDGEVMWCSSSKFHNLILCLAEDCKAFDKNLMFVATKVPRATRQIYRGQLHCLITTPNNRTSSIIRRNWNFFQGSPLTRYLQHCQNLWCAFKSLFIYAYGLHISRLDA